MAKIKKEDPKKPMTPEMVQMANAKLFDYINSKKFGSIEEINDFLNKNVNGKRIDEVIPSKKGPKSNLIKSDDLIYQAYDSDLVQGEKLAKESLIFNPQNVRALNYLADLEENVEEAMKLYKKAVDIGAKQLGENYFIEKKGHFWGIHETRPYMTAKLNYADCLGSLGKTEESIKEFNEMLELNPGDNQGVRYILSSKLLINKRYKEYHELYKKFNDESSAIWLFNYALYLFITQGASPKANKALQDAHKNNKHIVPIITGKKKVKTKMTGYYSPGDENEAADYLMGNFKAWQDHPASLGWLYHFSLKKK